MTLWNQTQTCEAGYITFSGVCRKPKIWRVERPSFVLNVRADASPFLTVNGADAFAKLAPNITVPTFLRSSTKAADCQLQDGNGHPNPRERRCSISRDPIHQRPRYPLRNRRSRVLDGRPALQGALGPFRDIDMRDLRLLASRRRSAIRASPVSRICAASPTSNG